MIVWARKDDVQTMVANVPDKWLLHFAAANPQHVRKFGDSRNSTLLYRSAAVLDAVEQGVIFKD